jgi:hypothetical protein
MLNETIWVEYTLSDGPNWVQWQGFNVIVTNQEPYFGTALSDFTVQAGISATYTIDPFDPEGNLMVTFPVPLQTYIAYSIATKTFTFTPGSAVASQTVPISI